jgi:hypothetical protein
MKPFPFVSLQYNLSPLNAPFGEKNVYHSVLTLMEKGMKMQILFHNLFELS